MTTLARHRTTVRPAIQRGKGPALVAGEDHTWARGPVIVHARKPAFLLFSYGARGVPYMTYWA